MSLKVSMGKREYQTRDKGDFSFPLSTLRDNLIVTLHDAEGKEVSQSVVDTRLVIEKGIWDDIFPLEGGGHVHLKLQFVLSEEDRHRIRIMRESASRKKHDELLKSEVGSPPHATIVGSDVESSLQHEFSGVLQSEVIQDGLRSTTSFNHFKKEGTHSITKHIKPNDTDRYADLLPAVPVSHRFDAHIGEGSHTKGVDKSCNQNPEKSKEDGAKNIEKNTRENTPSKIRNMISAFESSLSQDMSSKTRPSWKKPQPSKTRVEVSSSRHLNEVKVESAELAQVSGRVRNPVNTRDLQQYPSHIRKWEEQIDIRAKGTTEGLMEKVKIIREVEIEEEKIFTVNFARSSTSERASSSGRTVNEKSTRPLSNLFGRRRLSSEKTLKENTEKQMQPKEMHQVNYQRPSADEPYSSECSGAWVFPDGERRLCITTSGKQIMDFMGGFFTEAKNQLGSLSFPVAENVKQCVLDGTGIQVKEDGETSQRCEESKTKDSTDPETPRGPVGKVMRVVIMVGFATLVLFTRQRKPDK